MTISAVTFGATGAVGDPTSRYPSSWTIKFAVFMRVFASARKRRRPRTSTHASFASLSPSYTTSWRAEDRILYPTRPAFPLDRWVGLKNAQRQPLGRCGVAQKDARATR